jgi:asparagine synthase (glutamine-hydrolysing)
MCGIAGGLLVNVAPCSRISDTLLDSIRWRGRDGEGRWTDGQRILLVHSRLSIIDHTGGGQPMRDGSGDLVIVFNGEIYNHVELRKRYEALGVIFRTGSDTEVLLAGFRLFGESVLNDLIGMFAFAIWDTRNESLFLARDRIGKKPLYWYRHGQDFWFSSTLLSFRDLPGWTDRVSSNCIRFYGAVGSFPLDRSVYLDGRALPPGCSAWVSVGSEPRVKRYWHMDFSRKAATSLEQAMDEYQDLLGDSIRIRLRADVPVGLTFSGGVDSGSIAAVAAQQLGVSLRCFTVDHHTDAEPSSDYSLARSVAADLGLDWEFVQFDYRSRLLPELDEILRLVDQPCSQLAIVYSASLYRAIKPHASVVLSGNGADELFLGYEGNETLRGMDEATRSSPAGWRSRIRQLIRRDHVRSQDLADYQCAYVAASLAKEPGDVDPEELLEQLAEDIRAAGIVHHCDLYSFMSLRYFACDGNLRLPDIAGMLAQVEVRSPFLDHRMVEFAARLPSSLKVGDVKDASRNKLLPKVFYERLVPAERVWLRKSGMGSNIHFGNRFADDPAYLSSFSEALQSIEAAGLRSSAFAAAHEAFVRDVEAGIQYPASAGTMMSGFMLGRWLTSRTKAA